MYETLNPLNLTILALLEGGVNNNYARDCFTPWISPA